MSIIESLLNTFETGSGFWNPLIWLLVILIVFLIIHVLRGFGNKKYKLNTEQTKPFLSGNPEYEKEKMHIKGSNVYWGFTESLKWIFDKLNKMHTGNASDYVLWFIIIISIFFLLMGLI